ncbi:SulP family inorganic anion transporter, partial [Pseudomonas syringae pv. tagetis]
TLALGIGLKHLVPRSPTLLIAVVSTTLLVWQWPAMFGDVTVVRAFVGHQQPISPLPLDHELNHNLLQTAVPEDILRLLNRLTIARSLKP